MNDERSNFKTLPSSEKVVNSGWSNEKQGCDQTKRKEVSQSCNSKCSSSGTPDSVAMESCDARQSQESVENFEAISSCLETVSDAENGTKSNIQEHGEQSHRANNYRGSFNRSRYNSRSWRGNRNGGRFQRQDTFRQYGNVVVPPSAFAPVTSPYETYNPSNYGYDALGTGGYYQPVYVMHPYMSGYIPYGIEPGYAGMVGYPQMQYQGDGQVDNNFPAQSIPPHVPTFANENRPFSFVPNPPVNSLPQLTPEKLSALTPIGLPDVYCGHENRSPIRISPQQQAQCMGDGLRQVPYPQVSVSQMTYCPIPNYDPRFIYPVNAANSSNEVNGNLIEQPIMVNSAYPPVYHHTAH